MVQLKRSNGATELRLWVTGGQWSEDAFSKAVGNLSYPVSAVTAPAALRREARPEV